MAARIRSEYEVGLKDDTARGAASIKQELRGVAEATSSLEKNLNRFAAGLSLAGIGYAIRETVNFGDHLNDLSKATGATVEQLSFLDFAGDQSGTSIDALSGGVAKLQKNLATVGKGGGKEAAAALAAINLNANDLARQDLIGQLGSIGDGLAKIRNPAERSAVAQALFGKSAKDLLPFLLEGSKGISAMAERFVELNGVITQGQASKFDEMNDAIGQMRVSARGAGAAIGEALAPALTSLFSTIAEAVPQVGPFFDAFINRLQLGFAKLVKFTAEADLAIAESLQSTLGSLPGFDFSDKVEFAKQEVKDAAAVINEIDKGLDEQITERARRSAEARKAIASKGNVFAAVNPGGGDGAAAAKRLADAEAAAIAQLGLRKVAEEDVTEVARVRFQIEEGAYKAFSQASKDRLVAIAQEIDLQKQANDITKESGEVHEYLLGVEQQRRQAAEQAAKALNDERTKTIESLRTPQQSYADEVNRLLTLNLDDDTLQRGIDKARDAMQSAEEKAKDTTDAAKELGLTFSSAFEDAIVGAESFSEVLKGLASDIARLLVRKSITEPLANLVSGLFSGGAGASGGGFFNLGGLFGGGKASGGAVSAGKFYMVGEHGPELFAPGMNGSIIPNAGGGGVVVNVHNYGPQQDVSAKSDGRTVDVIIGSSLAKSVAAGRARNIGLKPALAGR